MKIILISLFLIYSAFGSTLTKVKSQYDVDKSIDALITAIEAKEGFGVFKIIDHQENARKVGLTMPSTKVIVFGNPRGGTPLMLSDDRIAYELPLRIMAYEDKTGEVWIAYKEPKDLLVSYDLNESPIPNNVSNLLKSLALLNAKENDKLILATAKVSETPELVRMKSLSDVETTISNLQALIQTKPGFAVAGLVDHQKNAYKAGLDQRPAQVLFFGNANAGTPLMLLDPEIAYELPLKIMSYEDETGQSWIVFKNPFLYQRDFNLGKSGIPTKMAGLLKSLALAEGSLDFEVRSKTLKSSIHADKKSLFTLTQEGSVVLSQIRQTGETALVVLKSDAEAYSGFVDAQGNEKISYPHLKQTKGETDIRLEERSFSSHITIEAGLDELVVFSGN